MRVYIYEIRIYIYIYLSKISRQKKGWYVYPNYSMDLYSIYVHSVSG